MNRGAALFEVLALAVGCLDLDERECGGVCVEKDTDGVNCGACGIVCLDGEVCDGDTCALSCQSGLIDCNGTCVDPNTDNTYCGASGDCQGNNAGTNCAYGEACANGTCPLSCTTVNNATVCTDGSIPQVNLGMSSATACHDQCQLVLAQNGISNGCWILSSDNNCYCRSGRLVLLTDGNALGGTCN